MTRLGQRLKRFFRREHGSATIEFILWLPAITGILVLTADATFLMNRQTMLYDTARDTARVVATGARSSADAEAALLARMGPDRGYSASVSDDGTWVTARVSVPFSEVATLSRLFGSAELVGQAVMLMETGAE